MQIRKKLMPPSQDDIENALRDLIKHGDQKPIAAYSRIHPSKLSRQLSEKEPDEPYLYLELMMIYGEVMHRPEIARGEANLFLRYMKEWGVFEESPYDAVKRALDVLRSLSRGEIGQMDSDQLGLFELLLNDILEDGGEVRSQIRAERRIREGGGRHHELDGAGRGEAVNR
jgi:hypothetical protein